MGKAWFARWGLSTSTSKVVVLAALLAAAGVVAALSFWSRADAPPVQTADTGPASVFDLVEECDLLAAHPADPQRVADGVADDAVVPRLAILACEAALRGQLGEPRFLFQLGRAQLAAGNDDEAFQSFQRAAGPLLTSTSPKADQDRSYAAAHGYLGDAYLLGQGVKADVGKAAQHYASAVLGKFEPAKKQMEVTRFTSAQYVYGSVLEALISNRFDSVKTKAGQDASFRSYLHSMTLKLVDQCESFLQPGSLVGLFYFRFPSGWSSDAEAANTDIGIKAAIGEVDAAQFVKRYGCEGPVAKDMLAGMNSFFAQFAQ